MAGVEVELLLPALRGEFVEPPLEGGLHRTAAVLREQLGGRAGLDAAQRLRTGVAETLGHAALEQRPLPQHDALPRRRRVGSPVAGRLGLGEGLAPGLPEGGEHVLAWPRPVQDGRLRDLVRHPEGLGHHARHHGVGLVLLTEGDGPCVDVATLQQGEQGAGVLPAGEPQLHRAAGEHVLDHDDALAGRSLAQHGGQQGRFAGAGAPGVAAAVAAVVLRVLDAWLDVAL